MTFPYTYKKSIKYKKSLFKENNINASFVKKLIISEILKKDILNFNEGKHSLSFTLKAPALNYEYSTKIIVSELDNEIIIDFEINIEKLIKIILIVVILTAFFSFLSVKLFLIISGFFSFILYSVSILTIDNLIVNMIKNSVEDILFDNDFSEKLSDEQIFWINDETRCSACGFYLSDFDLECPECGIKLKRNRYTIPMDISKYKDQKITYHIKKKKDNK